MQAVELRISGEYWDSFLYNDRLYLFTINGDILVYRWDQLIESLPIDQDHRPLFWQFLARGKDWYLPELQRLLESPKILHEVRSLANVIAVRPHDVSQALLQKTLVQAASSPAHPHTDVEAFYNNIYLSSSKGIHKTSLAGKLENNFHLSTDIPTFRVACSYGSMALAAGSEGMFEQLLTSARSSERDRLVQISSRPCAACSWASFDVIATAGPRSAGYIAAFSKPTRDEEDPRHLLGVVDAGELFPSSDGLLFGARDLLILAGHSNLIIDGWNPFRRRDNHGPDVSSSLLNRRELRVEALTDDAIDGAVTVFGVTVEMDDSLLIIGVDGTTRNLPEPVNWRCFPRSTRYLNQLHVTYDDHLRIYAFVDDYFTSYRNRGPAVRRPGAPHYSG